MKNTDKGFIKQVRRKVAEANPEYTKEIMLGCWDQSPAFARAKKDLVDSLLNSMVRRPRFK